MASPMGALQRYLSISCYDSVILNFYYVIAVHIRETCSKPLTLSSQRTFFNFKKSHTRVANMEYYEKTINNNPNKLYIF